MAAAHFGDTGRQAEIVEVKGSVELAPLTGLIANPVAHKLKAEQVDALVSRIRS